MRLFVRLLGGLIDWIFSILWLPVHLRTFLQTRVAALEVDRRAATASELAANAQVMQILWNLGTDYRPLARYIAAAMHAAYGVRPSELVPGQVVPLEKEQKKA